MLRELRAVLGLAAPVILAEIGWMAMGIVDALMVGPLGPAAIGATGMSGNLFIAVSGGGTFDASILGIGDGVMLVGGESVPRPPP